MEISAVATETPYWLQVTGVPGLTVALLEDGKTKDVHCFGSSDADGNHPITEATIFGAASLTKQAFLYAALKTIEAGKLDLNRPLTEYIQTPMDAPEADLEHITAYHVLTHTTGWTNWPDGDEPIKQVRPLGQWGYSGAGFVYLQNAMEAIWNEPAADYTRRLVLDPLGMTESSFVWREAYDTTATPGFDANGTPAEPWHPDQVNGASSLQTTAREYALLLEAYLHPGLQARHPWVYTPQVAMNARLGWSLGWGTADDVLWQWGHNTGFKAFAALRPAQGRGIVVLTNGDGGQRLTREWVNAWLETSLPAFFLPNVAL